MAGRAARSISGSARGPAGSVDASAAAASWEESQHALAAGTPRLVQAARIDERVRGAQQLPRRLLHPGEPTEVRPGLAAQSEVPLHPARQDPRIELVGVQ